MSDHPESAGETKAMLSSPGEWGTFGSAREHQRYAKPIDSRKRCPWCPTGQRKRVTHTGMANGVALTSGCEWHVAVWVRDPGQSLSRGRPISPPR